MPSRIELSAWIAAAILSLPAISWNSAPAFAASTASRSGSLKEKRPIIPLPEKPPSAGRLRIQMEYSGSSWDWNHEGHRIPEVLIRSIHRGLYRIGANGTLERDLVESEIASTDARLWTFRLRKDSTWSDGTPFTAEHAASGLYRSAELASNEPPDAVKRVEGYTALRSMSANQLTGVVVESENVLKIQLADPDPEFPLKLLDPRTFPVRSDLVRAHSDYGFKIEHMAFLGRWMVTDSKPGVRVKLRPNPYFQASPSKFQELELWVVPGAPAAAALYSRNQLDALLGPIQDIRADGVVTEPRSSLVWLQRSPAFESKCPSDCMMALSRAIDRNRLERFRPASSWIPPELWKLQQLGEYPQEASLDISASPKGRIRFTGPRSLRIGIHAANLDAADLEMLKRSAERISQSLKKTLGISCSFRIQRAHEAANSELILHLADAHNGSIESFLTEVQGKKYSDAWKAWNTNPPRSPERFQKFIEISRRELMHSPSLIPLGWGLHFRRLKPYVRDFPLLNSEN